MAASNTVLQDASNTSTESAGEAEEDDNNSMYEDKNLEERQDENKNSSNHANFQVDTAKNGAGSAEIINSFSKEGPLLEPSAQQHHQWSNGKMSTLTLWIRHNV
eukprot:13380649-Ditylum_brightwellii.AAC.1